MRLVEVRIWARSECRAHSLSLTYLTCAAIRVVVGWRKAVVGGLAQMLEFMLTQHTVDLLDVHSSIISFSIRVTGIQRLLSSKSTRRC